MLQIIFFYVVVEIPGDLVKLAHRAIRGENYREAGKWTYRCAGVLLVCSIAVLCAAVGTHGQS